MFTFDQKLAAIERELKLRKRVYPGRVERGRMSPQKAAHEEAVRESILEDYRRAVEREARKQGSLL